MPIVCPRCRRTLPSSDEPPRYCSYCGQKLAGDTPAPPGGGSTVVQPPVLDLPPEEATPAEIGGYRLLRLLGVGGMGRVFEAESAHTGQKVAVKLLSSQLTRNPVTVERFRQEGRLASQLSHPRCVFVLAADTEAGRPYIVMELMPGDTVKDLIDRRGPLPPREAIPLILDVIDGLQEAHRYGVIHRDVKPSNCFLMPDGRVKIGDFGLSKSLGASGHLTQSGAFLGTVLYASPEQIRGEPVEYASDVYSVCATLYHMLTGRPPFQHENITAALAKIISEDAPPVRSVKPDVPRSLARVVERGLERDLNRRWETLDELRSALVALVPSHLTYGGLMVRVGAYVLDEVLVRLLVILPLSVILHSVTGSAEVNRYVAQAILCLYFIGLEGVYGASLGKRVLRLRVCRTGSTDPPGLKLAALRTVTFYLLITATVFPAQVLFRSAGGGGGGLALAALPFAAGLLLLTLPMRKSNDFRGIHELVSGTCVMKLPRRARALALDSRRNRLGALPPPRDPFPAAVGPYAVKGAVGTERGEYVVVGEDTVLNRRVLVRLRPLAGSDPPEPAVEQSRPTRTRLLHHGRVNARGADYFWEAFVAPAGSALPDVVATRGRLTWPETRPLLEQLAEELAAAQKDGSLPPTLSLDQLWVQRDGRLQLLDFPVVAPGESAAHSAGPLDLLRDAATLALEGRVRLAGVPYQGPVRAPVPRHATEFLDRLLGSGVPLADAEDCRKELRESADRPTQIDQPLRLAQLTMQAVTLAPGLLMMLLVSGLFGINSITDRDRHARSAQQLLAAVDDPAERSRLTSDPRLAPFLTDEDKLRSSLRQKLAEDEAAVAAMRESLSAPERSLLTVMYRPDQPLPAGIEEVTLARALPKFGGGDDSYDPFIDWRTACELIVLWPAVWVVGAFLLRGGLSFQLLGIRIVDRVGRLVSRRRCALRAVLVWAPVAAPMCGSVWFQSHRPHLVNVHAFLWLAACVMLAAYFALALLYPDRPPHDQLLGTAVVPR